MQKMFSSIKIAVTRFVQLFEKSSRKSKICSTSLSIFLYTIVSKVLNYGKRFLVSPKDCLCIPFTRKLVQGLTFISVEKCAAKV